MLDAAPETVAGGSGRPVVHSARGAQYRWPGWPWKVGKPKLICSMLRKGSLPDNSACEGFFGRLKMELLYPWHWKTMAIEQFFQVLDSYIP